MENLNNDAVYDIPDERNYKYKQIFGVQETYPTRCIMDKGVYQNQGIETITKYMCVFYSTGHGNNEQNIIEGSKVRINCKDFGLLANKRGLLNLTRGAMLQSGPSLAKSLKYTAGYGLIQELNEIKDSIVNNKPIVVGTNKGDWEKANKAPYLLGLGTSYGHAFVIIGYDDEFEGGVLICKNSYGDQRGDNGKFYIKYSEYEEILFYSKFSLIDEKDPIITYKQKIMKKINIPMAKIGFELGIWNGENPTESASREEVVTMILRTAQKISNGEITENRINDLLAEFK